MKRLVAAIFLSTLAAPALQAHDTAQVTLSAGATRMEISPEAFVSDSLAEHPLWRCRTPAEASSWMVLRWRR